MVYFFTKAQLEARLSAKRVKRIFDDNSDGNADTDPVAQLRADASSKVRSFLEPTGYMPAIAKRFDVGTGELLAGKKIPAELVRLSLDVAVALACQRHPEVMRMDWEKLMKQCDADLGRVRDGKTSLGGEFEAEVTADPAPANGLSGATAIEGSPEAMRTTPDEDPTEAEGRFGDMGDYT